MLSFPTSTVFERRIPKQKFYQNLDVTAEVKRLFIEQIKLITWANKLSAQTMNLAPGQTVQEIEVFRIRMAGDVLDSRVLNLMDKQIPYHLLFVLERPDGKCQLSVTYKEASQSGSSAFQLRQNYRSDWLPAEGLTLNLTALNMDALYESIVRQIAGEYGIQMLDLTGHEYEEYFMCDTMHLGWKGWLAVDRALIDYYYGL